MNKIENILKNNSYPGRGIIAGKSENGKFAVLAYFIMGRSENSRNRRFILEDDVLMTQPVDYLKVTDPSLIIYNTMRRLNDNIILTNGDQTDTIYEYLKTGKTFSDALNTRDYEPDAPNYTPRISARIFLSDNLYYDMCIIKKSENSYDSQRDYYSFTAENGKGHFIHTYDKNSNPLISFKGSPKEIEIPDSPEDFAGIIWESLDNDNKISLYVEYIDLNTNTENNIIINNY